MCINCQIAKLNIGFNAVSSEMKQRLEKYVVEEESDYFISSIIVDKIDVVGKLIYQSNFYDLYSNDGEIIQYQRDMRGEEFVGTISYFTNSAQIKILSKDVFEAEYLMMEYATFFYILNKKDAMLIHSSSIVYKDNAYLFCAKSGTGKSTHTSLWVTNGLANYINDDKNIIVFENDNFTVYGNPFSGKHSLDNNLAYKLKGLIYLNRSNICEIKEISRINAYKSIISHSLLPNPLYSQEKWDNLVLNLLNTKAYSLGANISMDAVNVVKERLDGDLFEIE